MVYACKTMEPWIEKKYIKQTTVVKRKLIRILKLDLYIQQIEISDMKNYSQNYLFIKTI